MSNLSKIEAFGFQIQSKYITVQYIPFPFHENRLKYFFPHEDDTKKNREKAGSFIEVI